MNTQVTQQPKSQVAFFNQEKLDLIKKQFFPQNATPLEMQYCLSVAEQYSLDPILKQIYFVPRRAQNESGQWVEKIEPLVGRDGFLTIAHKTGKFAGIKSHSEVRQVPRLFNGEWRNVSDLVAICEVYRTDSAMPFIVEVAYSEYVQTRKDGVPTQFWATKPDTMLKKVAESQALRKAFNLSGLYSIEEVGVGSVEDSEIVIDTEAVSSDTNTARNEPKTINELTRNIEAIGLSLECKDGWAKVNGSTFDKKEMLKALGFEYIAEKKIWVQRVAGL